MKRNETSNVSRTVLLYSKIAKIMKLTAAFLLFACLQVSANGWSQDRITLKMSQADIKKVLFAIEKKSNYRFLFTEDAMKGKPKVNIDVAQATVSEVLDKLLSNTGISYRILATNLVVLKEGVSADEINNREVKVTGRVTSSSGDPLAGVSVVIKGSRTGTTTDANGNYSITAPDDAVLVFSTIGYENYEVSVAGKSTINATLQLSSKKIDEVVVIGYGTASKRDLTGSIVKISGKDIQDKPNTNPVASLQGKVAGLSVVNNGTPGASPDIRIRGTVSIGQVHPLYVVDGIFNDNIDYINPNDIESIEILKDPSSLAIFGVKGATGVIAITTKKAKAGQVIVNFNTAFGTKKLVDKIAMVNADQFNTLFAEENANNGVATPNYSALTANTDWVDAVTRVGKFNANNLSVSGSTDKNRFNLGVGFTSDEGMIIHEKLSKWQLSFSDEFKLSKAVKLGVNLNTTRQNNPFGAGGILDAARKVMPNVSAGTKSFKVANPYGGDSVTQDLYSGLATFLQNSGVYNPVLEIENTWNKRSNIELRTVGSLFGEVNFLKNFTLRSTIYADVSNVNNRSYSPLYYAYDPMTNTPYLYGQKTQVSENDDTYRKFQQDHILTFKKGFGDHGVTATAGFTTYYSSQFHRSGVANPFTTGNALPIPDDKRFWYITTQFNDPTNSFASSSQSEYSTTSALARLLYNYKGKYFFNASLRDDASSQIIYNRHQKFWALGGAWEISKEKFMEDISQINYLKLKASVGVLGNQSVVDGNGNGISYPFYPLLNTGSQAVFGTNSYGAAQDQWETNKEFEWETIHAKEVGIELNAFNNRLHFEANYFDKVTKNLSVFVDRSTVGLKAILENGGSIKNWGEEFSATWVQKVNKDFTINFSGNITFLKNKMVNITSDFPNPYISVGSYNNGSAESRSIIGSPIGSFYGYVVEGIYQSYADVLASPVASAIGSYGPGDFKFKDLNNDGKITADDRTIIGNPTPKFTYGGNINMTYKNFNLSVDLGGVYGNQVFRAWGSLESPFQRVNYPAFKMNRWHGAGTSNWDPIISQGHRFNYNGSTYNMEDGSYFRLRNLQLGYNFGQALISKVKMKNLRAYVNVQNMRTWKNNLGYTAEYGGNATRFGYDDGGGAIPVVTTVGLNVTF